MITNKKNDWTSMDVTTERRSDVLYTDEMNKEFYKQRINDVISQSFIDSEKIDKNTLVHPNNPSIKAKRVLSLLPCSELLGQSLFDVHLGNKLEKLKENEILEDEGLLAKIGFNEYQEKTLKLFKAKNENSNSKEESNTLSGDVMERIGEYGVLRKKLGEDEEQKMMMMVINDEESAEIKEMNYSLFLRNVKKLQEPEELMIEEDLEEETRFKTEEQEQVQDINSFLIKRLAQLYPSSEGVLWDKPHPPAKKHEIPKKETVLIQSKNPIQEKIPEEEESVDSLFDD
jgi:hypothetical protein